MSNHPFLAFLPAESAAISPLYFPNSQQPFILLPPSHLDGVSSCLTMLRMLHQAPQSACHISPGHPAREGGRHLCGHKSPCFGGREGERFPVCPTRRHADGRTRTPSQRASFEAKRKSMVGAAGCFFETFCMLTVSLHLRLDFTNRKPPTVGRMHVCPKLIHY